VSADADAIVVGAGICGAAAAFELAERGLDVLLLDRGAVAGGTTGLGEGNVLVCDKPPGPERDLAILGRDLWVELGERFPEAHVTRKGALLLAEGSDLASAHSGVCLDARSDPLLEPALASDVRVVHEPGDLQVDPRGLTRALVSRLRVREHVAVAAVERGAVVLASGQRLTCEHVVVATGPWAADLTGLPVEPRKGQLVALAAPRGLIRHKLVEAAYAEAVAGPGDTLVIATVIEQTLDGDEVLVGSSRERVGFDATVSESTTRALVARAARFVPALADLPVTRAWCGFRPWLPDGLPAIGEVVPGVWTTTGHEGAGVGLGPISGRLLAQLITGEAPLADPAPFDPRRFARVPG
jgi:glycine/D-amino acid oxidase-like deaminating enzyme